VPLFPDQSRSRLARWIRDGDVRVDGATARPSLALKPGQRVTIEVPSPEPVEVVPQPIPVNVVYEDADLLVVDKPAGLVVHPGAGHRDGTLVNGLLHRYGALSPVGAPLRPGIVHRLDAGTSGLLVVARTEPAHHALAKQLATREMERRYRAIVWDHGLPDEGVIRTLYGRHPQDRKKFTGRVATGKPAETAWRVAERLPPCALLELRLATGRTHQIRVHLSEAGHPVVGDPEYGRKRRVAAPPILRQLGPELGLTRQALHAWRLGFRHPRTGERSSFESALPSDIAAVLEALRAANRIA
jgi:23S rRNA pseudouridine1911/1915/1917 synthase